jgi:hypothetical protein
MPGPDPELIARWRPVRELRKPRECDGGEPCWVVDPYRAIDPDTTRCRRCRGRIGGHGARPSAAEIALTEDRQ